MGVRGVQGGALGTVSFAEVSEGRHWATRRIYLPALLLFITPFQPMNYLMSYAL